MLGDLSRPDLAYEGGPLPLVRGLSSSAAGEWDRPLGEGIGGDRPGGFDEDVVDEDEEDGKVGKSGRKSNEEEEGEAPELETGRRVGP
jgi:hypothetical protein